MRDQYIGLLAKKGELGKFTDLRRGLAKKEEVAFLRGLDTPMYIIPKKKKKIKNEWLIKK